MNNVLLILLFVMILSQSYCRDIETSKAAETILIEKLALKIDSVHKKTNDVTIYKSGRYYVQNNQCNHNGLFCKNLIEVLSKDSLTRVDLKKYKILCIRGNLMFYGSYAGIIGVSVILGPATPIIVFVTIESAMIWGLCDLINKQKSISKAIWIYNKDIERKRE